MQVLEDIRLSKFYPDCTRSGRFAKADGLPGPSVPHTPMPDRGRAAGVEGAVPDHGKVVDLVSEKEESSGTSDVGASSSSSDNSSQEEFQEEQRRARVFLPPEPPEGYVFWQHTKLKTLHLAPPEYRRVFILVTELHPLWAFVPAMTLVDSAASFEKRCSEIDDSGALLAGLKTNGIKSFSALAFTVGTPQVAPTDTQYEDLSVKVFGRAPTLGQISSLRRLHFESTTLIVASLNEQVKSDASEPGALVKRLPAAEKQSRHEKQQERLAGIKIVGEMAPSHQLLDLANSIVESGAIVWIAPSRCSKRDDEIHANIRPASSTVQVENSTLKLAQVPVSTSADLGTDLKLMWAFQRRGLAMDSCRLLDWSHHESWLQYMLNAMTRDCPSGFHAVRAEQVIKADQQLWTILAQENAKSLKPVNDVPALNQDFKALTTDPRVTMYLLPVPAAPQRSLTTNTTKTSDQGSNNSTKPAGTRKKRKLTRAQKSCPAELKDFDLKLAGQANGPICWGYNMKTGCSNETSNQSGLQRCKRGFHDNRELSDDVQMGPKRVERADKSIFATFADDKFSAGDVGSKFSGLGLEEMLVVEICAGSARLTKTVRARGIRGLAVDKTKDRSCGTDIMLLDLTIEHDLNLLLQILSAERDRILLVFISPPCGTASKARERPIAAPLLDGRKQPVPLRSHDRPDQKDGLAGLDKFKTEMANQLYEAVTVIIFHCDKLGLWVLVENPKNSLYWATSFAQQYILAIVTFWIDFHNCAHGGARDKLTRLWSNRSWGQSLQLFCDKQHIHASWRPKVVNGKLQFPTAEEAAYPWLFCERLVNIVEQFALHHGCIVVENLKDQVIKTPLTNFQRYVFDALPRSSKLKPLVSEYGRYFSAAVNPQNTNAVPSLLKQFPKGTKLVSRQLLPWGKFRVEMVDLVEVTSWTEFGLSPPNFHFGDAQAQGDYAEVGVLEICKFGIPSTPDEFVYKALQAGHPRDLMGQVSDMFKEAILSNFHRPPHLVAKERVEFVKKYTKLASDLRAEELKLRLGMPKHVASLMRSKRLVLWGRMLEDLHYPDVELIRDIAAGLSLSGWMPKSNVFMEQVRQPVITVEALLEGLAGFNEKVSQQMRHRQEEELEKETWNETLEELDKGWVWEDPDQSWDRKCVARRFGIHQGEKTRVIDDCSVCGLNQTVGLREKCSLQAVDQMCAILCWSLRQAGSSGHCAIVGRTFDLKAAYKQFGLRTFDRDLLRIAVRDPGRKDPVLIGLNSLPFGGVGSVAGFLRISMATWYTGLAGLKLCWTGYFDDFSVVSRPELQNNATWAVDSLFGLIGLDYAKDGAKAPEFSQVFRMLGVQIDTSGADQGFVTVGHTAERRKELAAAFESAVNVCKLSNKTAESLRGRMVFYECFSAGRTTNLLLKDFGQLCRDGRSVDDLSQEQCDNILSLRDRVRDAEPIVVSPKFMTTWYVFTDGACETGDDGRKVGGVGGVLISACGSFMQHFGISVPTEVMDFFLQHSKHPVHELEILPVLISFLVWSDFLRQAQVLHYTDNDSCRFALMKGVGETAVARHLVSSILRREHALQTKSWYGRVPSYSNPSDDPSRGSFKALLDKGSHEVAIPWGEILRCLPIPNGEIDGGDSKKIPNAR
eukprot:s379_g27.t1